ncbi:MAG: DUF4335 domain-containing protein [Synechococcaceae cyanobacterium RL_1_2]|nr:DUF4335 domain-containing protein [Synechococcaceae cyanobacterium RL_1_2]
MVKSVSNYVQGFLSGLEHRHVNAANQEMVNLMHLPDSYRHRLSISQVKENTQQSIDLTTAELFDLMEAIDQCLADHSTLPELTLKEKPLPRKYRRSNEPIVKRFGPPVLGLASIAIAAGLSLLLPTPSTITNPNLKPGEQPTTESNNPAEEDQSSEEAPGEPKIGDLKEIESALQSANKIEDPTELQFIQRYLKRTIGEAWEDRAINTGENQFRVTATRDGSIVEYAGVKGTPDNVAETTPLPALKYNATSKINTEAIADF